MSSLIGSVQIKGMVQNAFLSYIVIIPCWQ